MRRVRLGSLLIGLNTGLVALAVICVSIAGVRLLGRMADEQALARVGLAGANALQAVERSAGDVATSADLLSERPTVGRLLRQGETRSLTSFLEQFRETSRLSGCAVIVDGRRVAESGTGLPWGDLLRATAGRGAAVVRGPGGHLVLAAAAPLTSWSGATAIAARRVDPAFTRDVVRQIGLPVEILAAEAAEADEVRRPLRERALETGETASGRLEAAEVFLSVRPLRAPSGRIVGFVETSLPTASVASSLSRLVHLLVWISALVVILASLSGLLISRRLTGPMRALTSAAARIGRGDLATPVQRDVGTGGMELVELDALASTLDETRRQLLRLTSELRRRQAEGEAILTGISEGVFSVDRDRRIRYLNPQAARLLGVTPEEAIGRFCGDVLKPVGANGVRPCEDRCPILHARFRGGTRASERLQLPDGTQRTVVINSSPPAEDLQFQVISDETELEAARRLRDALLANISHEFKTPLAAQRASIELLRERLEELDRESAGGDAQTRALVLALERGGLRLTQLVDNLLESVRIEAGHASIRRRPVALDEVVEEAVEMTSPLLGQRGQRLELDLPYPLPEVEGDAPRLTQVFVNLLANANKYAPADSLVRIGGEVRAEVVSLWVEDEGPGMSGGAGGAGRSLFERFVRSPGREDDEPEQSGMGLGLWIVQSIVERHGGTVEARREGEGTRVRVTLPRHAKRAERATA
jgi:signal transduction histidine kinase/HAMP domain-containing protein